MIILIPYYYYNPTIKAKSLTIISYIFNKNKNFKDIQKQALLTMLVKFFFIPIMINWLLGHISSMINNMVLLIEKYRFFEGDFLGLFNSYLFNSLFQIILFLDVLFFTIGYLIELPKLKNQIISVEPTIFGWIICIICYPPFNSSITNIIGRSSSDFPKFQNPIVHIILNIIILILMGIYTFASINLNFKASNLTNRGIVTYGVYSIIRHPAYVTKNLAWWIGGIPILISQFNNSIILFGLALFSLISWSYIYYLRAITEEKHLLLGNNGYKEYCQNVKYRFIPGYF